MAPSKLLDYRPKGEDKNTKAIKEMIRGNFRCTRYFLRSCKSRWSFNESIPDELLFEILVRLPAQDIYYASRLVCTRWYHVVCAKDFIQRHLEHASYGLLYRDGFGNVVFISAREGGGIHKYKLYYNGLNTTWTSCNGLMLKYQDYLNVIYDVVNVSTGKALRLPRFPYRVFNAHNCGIGYDATSMTYKVVVTYQEFKGNPYRCGIFTVGVDKSWRNLRTDHLSLLAGQTIISKPIITEGHLHWGYTTKVVTLNLVTEEMVETSPPIPRANLEEKTVYCCMSTGRYLTLLLQHGKLVWEFYEMKPETREWRKLSNICLEGQEGRIERLGFEHVDDVELEPYGWLKYPEVLALRVQKRFQKRYLIFYNLTTHEIGAENLPLCIQFFPVTTLYKNSLVWF